MLRARSPEGLASNPIDHYWLGEHQLVWCSSAKACGSLHWGEPTDADALDLTKALALAHHPALADGVDVMIDCSAIDRVPWSAFEILLRYARTNVPAWSHRIQRQVVVAGEGPTGALLVGMAPMIGETFPMRVVHDPADGLAWLDWPEPAHRALHQAIAIAADARRDSILIHLRAWLNASVAIANIEGAAAALGRSCRTLQRELASANTSFTVELAAARVRVAASRLVDSDDKIEAIARDVGYTTASRLSATFRRHKGVTPARFRELNAAGASRANRTRRA